jgi:SAM-dependent methyltransferase
MRGTVLDLRPPRRDSVQGDDEAWAEHWSAAKQETAPQRFFSWYRKAVFARTVAYFVGRYLPRQGVLVEAGSGTSETSIRIDKAEGGRVLVALDLIPAVLERCAPIMDVRVSGDVFRLPFRDDSVDGIWNVGVMEHFTQAQIDAMLREFLRVLRPGGRMILLWPGTDSVPQRLLDAAAWIVNHRRAARESFRFHPPEISRLQGRRHGRAVLARNGFVEVTIDPGFLSLAAFKTVVGEKSEGSRADRPAPPMPAYLEPEVAARPAPARASSGSPVRPPEVVGLRPEVESREGTTSGA